MTRLNSIKDCDTMVLCPNCNNESNDEEYCTECGSKLTNIKKNFTFEFNENNEISNNEELNIYFNQLNDRINKQKKLLDELNNDFLVKKDERISIDEENNELKNKILELEENNEKISLDLNQQRKLNSKLQAEIDCLNFCPHCGKKLS